MICSGGWGEPGRSAMSPPRAPLRRAWRGEHARARSAPGGHLHTREVRTGEHRQFEPQTFGAVWHAAAPTIMWPRPANRSARPLPRGPADPTPPALAWQRARPRSGPSPGTAPGSAPAWGPGVLPPRLDGRAGTQLVSRVAQPTLASMAGGRHALARRTTAPLTRWPRWPPRRARVVGTVSTSGRVLNGLLWQTRGHARSSSRDPVRDGPVPLPPASGGARAEFAGPGSPPPTSPTSASRSGVSLHL